MFVEEEWLKTANMRPEIELGEFVIMPNHFHAIIGIIGTTGVTDTPMHTGVCDTPLQSPSTTIGTIIRGFKSAVTSHARRNGLAVDIWQRNYYEHIIRNSVRANCTCLAEGGIRPYESIRNNPAQWQEDEYFR